MIAEVVAGIVLAVSAVAITIAWRRRERTRASVPAALEAERMRYLRAAQFPATCSWCKSTAIASHMLVFEGHGTTWHAADLMEQLRTCPDDKVDALAAIFTGDHAAWRRFCAEKCVHEFLAAAPASEPVAFVTCAGCGGSYPASLGRCASCDVSKPVAR